MFAYPLSDPQILDYDGDGVKDVVFLDGSSMAIALGNGNGSFRAPTYVPLTRTTNHLVLADVNGDGKLDLVFGRYAIFVRLNDGSGGFGAVREFDLGTIRVRQLATIDVNGDTRPDLVAHYSDASAEGFEIAVLLNTGTSFAARARYPVGINQSQIALSDVTGDGFPDVVTTSSAAQTVSVLKNRGDGTFDARIVYPSVDGSSVVVIDVDEDGKRDVVLGASSPITGAQISVMINQGGGELGAVTSYPAGLGRWPWMIKAADVNGDGHLDVGLAGLTAENGRLLLGTGSGQFGPVIEYTHKGPWLIDFDDLDNDGRVDMLLGLTPYLNTGAPRFFETRTTFEFGMPEATPAGTIVRLSDINSDGLLDVIFAGQSVATRMATSAGVFGPPAFISSGFAASRPTLADMDNNGTQDVVLHGSCPGQCDPSGVAGIMTILIHEDGSVSAAPIRAVPFTDAERTIADLNGDGLRDLIVGDKGRHPGYEGEVRYYPGLGDGLFASGVALWSGIGLNALVVVDLNHDAKADLVVGSNTFLDVRQEVLLATGSGSFEPPVLSMGAALPNGASYARDLNEDGRLDVIGLRDWHYSTLLGNGDGTLGDSRGSTAPEGATRIEAFADIDGDGHLDLVAPASGYVAISIGRGDGSFEDPRYYESGVETSSLTVGDVDDDGRLDIMLDNAHDTVSVLHGRCLR